MENIYILLVLIVALIGLIGLRKENNRTITDYIKKNKELKEKNQNERHRIRYEFQIKLEEFEDELKKEKKSNAANKTWITRYRNTIEELEEKKQDQADTIKRMSSQFDEVHVLLETLLVTKKKEQQKLIDEFTFKTK